MRKIKSYEISINCDTAKIAMLMYLYIKEIDCLVNEPTNNTIKLKFVPKRDIAKYKKFGKLLNGVKITIDNEIETWR